MNKISINGMELAFERSGHGTPMVLIHGYPLDHSIWHAVVPLLEKDFDLILPDLRGFGESSIANGSSNMPEFAGDIATLMDSLKIKKAILVGHSMGGYVALEFARGFARRLLGLGLVASQGVADTPEKKVGRVQEAEHILSVGVAEVAADMPSKLTATPALQVQLKELIMRQDPKALSAALHAMAERLDSMQLLRESNFPVVVVHGLEDKLIPIERARSIKDVVKNGYLSEIENCGHMPMMDAPRVTANALKILK